MSEDESDFNNQGLQQLIRQEIEKSGPISCERFIELALYHPHWGYYSQDRLRVGHRGDFITNVSVGEVFGSILAEQIAELWELAGKPAEFVIVEPGAESGDLAADIVSSLAREYPEVPSKYFILEPHPEKQARLQGRLTGNSFQWIRDWEELGIFNGIVVANELLDALPCRVIEFSDNQWKEVSIGLENDAFAFRPGPITSPSLATEIAKLPAMPFQPYRTEINLTARNWVNHAAKHLACGYLLFIDYGYSRTEYYSPLRTEGTLTGYRIQRRQNNVLERIGETDITAHVDFTAVTQAALEAGCRLIGFTDQHHFMVGAGEKRLLSMEADSNPNSGRRREKFLRAYKTLMHPETMGLAFKYLLLGKGLPGERAPSGFRYAGDPKKALELA
jgi:SAM-dependent MidA family methyltransferase